MRTCPHCGISILAPTADALTKCTSCGGALPLDADSDVDLAAVGGDDEAYEPPPVPVHKDVLATDDTNPQIAAGATPVDLPKIPPPPSERRGVTFTASDPTAAGREVLAILREDSPANRASGSDA